MIRKARAAWRGAGRDGKGELTAEAAVSLDSDGTAFASAARL